MPNLVSIACIVAQNNAFIQTDKAKSTRLLMWSKKFYFVGTFTPSSACYIYIKVTSSYNAFQLSKAAD